MKKRIYAFLIDHFIFSSIAGLLGVIILSHNISDGKIKDRDIFLFQFNLVLTLVMLLYTLKDIHNSSSIGKKILGLKVIDIENPSEKLSIFRLVLRNVFLIIWPIEFFVSMSNPDHSRLGDMVAKTKVVSIK